MNNIILQSLQDLQIFFDKKIPESKRLEYKKEISKNEKLLKIVCAFANTEGGILIIGMEEDKGVPIQIVGISISDPDKEISRLENIIKSSTSPRIIMGITTNYIQLLNGNYVFILDIKNSPSKPHGFKSEGKKLYYIRTSTSSEPLEKDEIDALYAKKINSITEINNFRNNRIKDLVLNHSSEEPPKVILHMIPLDAFDTISKYDINCIIVNSSSIGTNKSSTPNGIIFYPSYRQKKFKDYTEIYFNGIIEIVSQENLLNTIGNNNVYPDPDINNGIIYTKLESSIIKYIESHIENYIKINIHPPIYIFLSFIGIDEYLLILPSSLNISTSYEKSIKINKPSLMIKDIIIENFSCNISEFLKPLFDELCNNFGLSGSPNCNIDGKRKT